MLLAKRRRQLMEARRHRPTAADPDLADRAQLAREQMQAFDRQAPEVRQALQQSLFGVPVDIVTDVTRRGPNNDVRAALRERGVLPCDVGTEGVVIETVRQIDRREASSLRALAAGDHPDPLP